MNILCTNFLQWQTEDCSDNYISFLNFDGRYFKYNPNNLQQVQQSIEQVFDSFLNVYSFTDDSKLSNPFQYTLLELCMDENFPGGCDLALQKVCKDASNKSNIYSQFCSCYLNISDDPCQNECDAGCSRNNVVKRAKDGQICKCNLNICAIDDLVIESTNSVVVGGANISNICPTCAPEPDRQCKCILTSVDVPSMFVSLGLGDQIGNFCSSESEFYQVDSSGNLTKVNLSDIQNQISQTQVKAKYSTNLPIILVTSGLAIIFIVIYLVYSRST